MKAYESYLLEATAIAVLQFADLKACNEGVFFLQLWGIATGVLACST